MMDKCDIMCYSNGKLFLFIFLCESQGFLYLSMNRDSH